MAWWRSPAIPSTALVILNPEMQDGAWDLHIKSQAGGLPIMPGDPGKLSANDLKMYREFADWLQFMENRYSIMSFRQDLPNRRALIWKYTKLMLGSCSRFPYELLFQSLKVYSSLCV